MRVLTERFIREYYGSLLNIHPSLLPKYPGLHTHRRALEAGDTESGATVHFVIPALDAGPAIAHARVPIVKGDTPEALAARVQSAEHRLYPQVLAWCLSGSVMLRDGGLEMQND
jgi:phosphoribosylglycinamide formyltransferase-1